MSIGLPARPVSPSRKRSRNTLTGLPATPTSPTSRGLYLRADAYDSPGAWTLITALRQEQLDTYGFADDPATLPAQEFAFPGLFIVGYSWQQARWQPSACAGMLFRSPEITEVKKMFVLPQVRGQGWGHAVLEALEQHARLYGARRMVLETGARNLAAMALYRSHGYQAIPPYVQGRDPQINRAFAKDLLPPAAALPPGWTHPSLN